MASVPKPKLSPLQRAAGVIGGQNAQWLFDNYAGKHFNIENLSTVGDDAWGTVLRQTQERVRKNEERATRRVEAEAPAPEPTPPPQPQPAPAPPAPAQPAPVPSQQTGPATATTPQVSPSGRTGRSQLRTDPISTAATTGLQLPG